MLTFVEMIAKTLAFNLLQIIIGSIIAILIYKFIGKENKTTNKKLFYKIGFVFLFSFLGLILPLEAFGIIPIVVALLVVGFSLYEVAPLIFSNSLFNMLVPSNEPSFIFRTGILRIMIAYLAGVLIGLILWKLNWKEDSFFKIKKIKDLNKGIISSFFTLLKDNLDFMGIYLLIGVAINTFINEYFLLNSIDVVYSNNILYTLLKLVSGFNVVNPIFLVALAIVSMLLNFVKLSALISIFKPKGLITFYIYFIVIAGLFSITILL